MTVQSMIFALVLVAAILLFVRNARRLIGYLRIGKNENRFDRIPERVATVLRIAFGQTKLLREPLAGFLHVLVFWGFVILLAAVLESIGEGLIPHFSFSFLGPLYGPLIFLEDLFGGLVFLSVLVYLYRRIIAPPARLRVSGHAKWDAIFILSMILLLW